MPSVPETPENVRPGLFAFVSIWRKSYTALARCTSMGGESMCTSTNCKTLETTSPVVFVRGKGSPLPNKDRSFNCPRWVHPSVSKVERSVPLNSVRVVLLDYGGNIHGEPASEREGQLFGSRQAGQQRWRHNGVTKHKQRISLSVLCSSSSQQSNMASRARS